MCSQSVAEITQLFGCGDVRTQARPEVKKKFFFFSIDNARVAF